MLEPRPLLRRRRAGEDLQPGVELERVGRDRDGVLAVAAQRLGERDRDLGLPHAGGPEQRDDHGRRIARRRRLGGAPGRVRSVGDGRTHRQRTLDGGGRALRRRGGGRGRARRARRPRRATSPSWSFSGAHLAAPEATLEGVHEALAPAELVGCGAGGVIGEMREVEEGTAGLGLGRGARRRRGDAVPRRGRGDRRRRRRALRPARPDRRRRGAAALRPVHVPDRRGAARAVALRADAAAARRPRLRAVARRGDAAPARRRGLDGGRGRRPLRRRRDPAVRLAGRGADRARADDHRRRGTDHRRARGQAGAREAARDDRGARRRGPADGPGRAADGDRDRREQARLRAGRLPRPRARRRRPRHGPGGRRQRRAAGSGRAAARARRRQRRPRPARRARRADASRSAGGRRPARC